MEITQTREGAVTVLKPGGPLLAADADQFKSVFTDALPLCLGRVVVDASAIPYVDSRGLEVLVEIGDELSQFGQTLKLCGANETIREVMDLTETLAQFEQFGDVHSAVRSFL
jgi:anti-sigma B factor antagonist